MAEPKLVVRELQLADVDLRINYFHDSTDEYLEILGVDRARLPTREAWRAFYEEDDARPLSERLHYGVIWELDGETVGFSSSDQIEIGRQAFMHLHVTDPSRRQAGLGARFVGLSARHYFEVLQLQRLFSEPHALNVAPNRALQRAGFRYVSSQEGRPGPINRWQVSTRWVLERPADLEPVA